MNNAFRYIVLFAALFLAVLAATFSITGITELFSGALLLCGLMALSLEIGKIVSLSFLYRNWNAISKILRGYLLVATVTVSLITSTGIYGFLLSAFSKGSAVSRVNHSQIEVYNNQLTTLDASKNRIINREVELSNLIPIEQRRLDTLIKKNRNVAMQEQIMQNQINERAYLELQISHANAIEDSLIALKLTLNSIHTNTEEIFYYIATILGISLDKLIVWFALIITLVFDPLSLALMLAYNFLEMQISNKSEPLMPVGQQNVSNERIEPLEGIGETVLDETAPVNRPLETPYYLLPGFDWKTDDRWHSDSAAKAYYAQLGMH